MFCACRSFLRGIVPPSSQPPGHGLPRQKLKTFHYAAIKLALTSYATMGSDVTQPAWPEFTSLHLQQLFWMRAHTRMRTCTTMLIHRYKEKDSNKRLETAARVRHVERELIVSVRPDRQSEVLSPSDKINKMRCFYCPRNNNPDTSYRAQLIQEKRHIQTT
jgi:hypothetical protein